MTELRAGTWPARSSRESGFSDILVEMEASMRAAFYEGHETISLGECVPVAPAPGQAQIRVSHCGICGTDLHIFHGKMDHRVKMPQVIGHEMSGVIAAVGEGVAGFAPGDRVTVRPLDHCGDCPACRAGHSHICQKLKFIGIDSPGAFQETWTVPAHTLHRLPDSLSLREAALIEPLAVACHDVRLGEVKAGEYVVVQGGGPIGALVAMVAAQAGARVLVSEINPFRLQLAARLGLRAVDPNQVDLVEMVTQETGGAGADVVFEVTGSAAGAEMMTRLPRTRGRMVMVAIYSQPVKVDLFRFFWRELRLIIRGVVRTVEMWSNSRSRCENPQALRRQELLRHKDFETMMVYTHVLRRRGREGIARSTGSGSLSPARPWGLCGPASPHRIVEETCRMERNWRALAHAARRWRFRLRPAAPGFMQVGLVMS